MSKYRKSRKSAGRRAIERDSKTLSTYHRTLRFEPLEDRRVLAVVTVTTLGDTIDFNDGLTSLREAIFATNTVPGADTIDFAPSLTAAGPAAIVLTQGELKITDDLTINGPGASLLTIDASGNDPTPDSTLDDGDATNDGDGSRVFNIDRDNINALTVLLNGLTLTGGDTVSGGAILNSERLSITSSTISGNSASFKGGGISSDFGSVTVKESAISGNFGYSGGGIRIDIGNLTLTNSTISGNFGTGILGFGSDLTVAFSTISGNVDGGIGSSGGNLSVAFSTISGNSTAGNGGGINFFDGNLNITSSTISGNSAEDGGGIHSANNLTTQTATILNSTISGNTATHVDPLGSDQRAEGGGIYNDYGRMVIGYCTITNNTAPDGFGSGILSKANRFTRTEVYSTIITGNTNSDVDIVEGPINSFQSNGYNLIGTGNSLAAFNQPGDQTGVTNPMLGPLADNGGPTLTHALLPGSPAINTGDPAAAIGVNGVPLTDQRGVPFIRVYGGRIDIGAFEVQPTDRLLGDFDRDGIVDNADYAQWRKQTGMTVEPDTGADANGDGVVNDVDYQIWKFNFGRIASLSLPPVTVGMPSIPDGPIAESPREHPPIFLTSGAGLSAPITTRQNSTSVTPVVMARPGLLLALGGESSAVRAGPLTASRPQANRDTKSDEPSASLRPTLEEAFATLAFAKTRASFGM